MFYPIRSAIVNRSLVLGTTGVDKLTIALFTDYGESDRLTELFKVQAPAFRIIAEPTVTPRTLRDVSIEELLELASSYLSKDAMTIGGTRNALLDEMLDRLKLRDLIQVRTSRVGVPLWQKLGWMAHTFQPGELPDAGALMGARNGNGELVGREQYEVLFREACEKAGVPTDETALNVSGMGIGKGDLAVFPTADSVVIDIEEVDHYRVADFVKGTSTAQYELPLSAVRAVKGKTTFGDGVVGRVRPETIGYDADTLPEGEKTALQFRGFVFSDPKRVFALYKGFIEVDPFCRPEDQYILPEAGYGRLDELHTGHTMVIEVLTDLKDYRPKGRVSLQARYYEGHPNWKARFQNYLNLRLRGLRDWERMVSAEAALMFLPVDAYISILRQAAVQIVSFDQGVRRKVLPGLDLAPYEFRAPYELRHIYKAGKQYVIHRDPATPDGMAAFSATCVGYVRANAFEVPTNVSPYTQSFLESRVDAKGKVIWSTFGCWEQGGGDFDGDDALVTPHWKQGGLLLGFNDRSMQARQALMEAAGRGGRKDEGFTKLYPNGFVRWMWQRWAAVELGMLDFRARKLIDQGGDESRLQAAALKPLIQTAVDRQKRDLEYPTPLADLPPMSGRFATKIFAFLRKPDSEISADKQGWKHSWDMVALIADHCRAILDGNSGDEDLFIDASLHEGVRPIAQWVVALYETVCKATGTRAEVGHYPKANRLPVGDITRLQASVMDSMRAADPELAQARFAQVQELDETLVALRRSNGPASRAFETLLKDWLEARPAEEREALVAMMPDPNSFVRLASARQLEELFMPHRTRVTVQTLPGVVVADEARDWKYSKVGVGAQSYTTLLNNNPMILMGAKLESGELELRSKRNQQGRWVTTMFICGVPTTAQADGQPTVKTAREMLRELSEQLHKQAQAMPEGELERVLEAATLDVEAFTYATTLPKAEPEAAPEVEVGEISYEPVDCEPVWDAPVY